jgi:SSS family solute:Na+ symporter
MGVLGRALHPDRAALHNGSADAIYPTLVRDLGGWGLKGLIVAGIFAAALSTYDSIGSAMSALLTRDVYARILAREKSDRHYMWVGRWLTPVIILGSFAYFPFLGRGMLDFYLELTSVLVMPLLTLYLLGAFTRVNRQSGWIALSAGAAYGLVRLFAPWAAERWGIRILPPLLCDKYAAYCFSVLATALAAVLVSALKGWEPRESLLRLEGRGWLAGSQKELGNLLPAAVPGSWSWLPAPLILLVLAAAGILSFWVLW